MRKLLLTLPALVFASAAALGQATPPPPPPAGTAPAAAPQAYRAKQVLGARVTIQDRQSIGTVDDIVFDEAGQVEYLIVADSGRLVSVPWEAAKFNFTSPTPAAVVNITREQFKAIPTFTVTTYPNFYAPTYRTEVYRFYGLTPGQQRRLERRN